jgi:hypothetical protein
MATLTNVFSGTTSGGDRESQFNEDAFKPTTFAASDTRGAGGCNEKRGWYGPAKGQCKRAKRGADVRALRSQQAGVRKKAAQASRVAAQSSVDPNIFKTVDNSRGSYGKERVIPKVPTAAKDKVPTAAKEKKSATKSGGKTGRQQKAAELRAKQEQLAAQLEARPVPAAAKKPARTKASATTKPATKAPAPVAAAKSSPAASPAWPGLDSARTARLNKLLGRG